MDIDFARWKREYIDSFQPHLEAHISHTRYLRICGPLQFPLPERLVSSAPILKSLSLSHEYFSFNRPIIPVNLFNCTAPNLTSLKLKNSDISWKSPQQTLEILWPSTDARPKLEDWLDTLNEMSQLKTLFLHSATQIARPLISRPLRTVTLSSLIKFHVSASAEECALALACLMVPALALLNVDAKSHEEKGEDVQQLIPIIARNAFGLQDTEPLRSIMISSERIRVDVFAWIMPNADLDGYDLWKFDASILARFTFTATGTNWHRGVDLGIFDALLGILPVDSISTFIVHNYTRLSKEFWLSQAPRWSLLE